MKCPVCGSYDHQEVSMSSEQFNEQLNECQLCGSRWAVNHGLTELVDDTQLASFLQGQGDSVESDDYNWAA